jgi:hypothetical protein
VTSDAAIPNGWSLQDRRCGPPEVGLGLVASVMYGMFRALAGASALYYRFLETASTLLRRSNISGRSYC